MAATVSNRPILLTENENRLGPYLKFKHAMSQIWMIHPVLSIIFVIFRLQLSAATAQDAVDNVKQDLLAGCKAAEHAATSVASLPRYLAVATNKQLISAVNGTLNGARNALILSLTALEGIINFVIDIFRSTFFCFLDLLIKASLSVATQAVNALNTAISATGNGIRSVIIDSINGINKAIAAVTNIIKVNPPQIQVPSLDKLQNLQLPQDVTDKLNQLSNAGLPNIDDLKNNFEAAIDKPFETLKQEINATFNGLTFDANALPIPSQKTVTFCDHMDTSIVDGLGHEIQKKAWTGIYILIGVIVVLLLVNGFWQWRKWRSRKMHLAAVRNAMLLYDMAHGRHKEDQDHVEHKLMWMDAMMKHPSLTACIARKRWSDERKDRCNWFCRYIFYPPALACLLIGLSGLISVEIQFATVAPLQRSYEARTAAAVSSLSDFIMASVNQSMYDDSVIYANAVNSQLNGVQQTVNDGVFKWIGETTSALNTTIGDFYTEMQDTVQKVFGSTLLADPVQNFVHCIVGTKVEAMENALTFLHDNLHINVPQVDDDVLVLSPNTVAEATQPIAQAAVGSGDGNNNGLVGRIVSTYLKSLEKERIMFAIFIGLWLTIVVIGIFICVCGGRRTAKDVETATSSSDSSSSSSSDTMGWRSLRSWSP